MKTLPEGLKAIEKLLRKRRKLTCCGVHQRCSLCGRLPYLPKVESPSYKRDPSAWLQATVHLTVRPIREMIY
jgi:hypothetical protein